MAFFEKHKGNGVYAPFGPAKVHASLAWVCMSFFNAKTVQRTSVVVFLIWETAASATDWPQYRGPTTDGSSPDPILTTWPSNGPPVLWRNSSLSNLSLIHI